MFLCHKELPWLIEIFGHEQFRYVILGMDSLRSCYTSIGYRTRVVKCHFINETILEKKGENYMPRFQFVYYLKN